MQDHELYRRILGIEAPWFVDSVELKLEAGEIHVYLRNHDLIKWPCPECGAACKLYDHQPERRKVQKLHLLGFNDGCGMNALPREIAPNQT